MKTAIIYASYHHQNTKALVDAIAADAEAAAAADAAGAAGAAGAAAQSSITLIDALAVAPEAELNLSDFDRIGLASGIYFSKFHKRLLRLAEKNLPLGKDLFFLYTAGAPGSGSTASVEKLAEAKSARILGSYGCKGFDTYGPFKLVGGIAKGHPDTDEIAAAVSFYRGL